MLLQWMTSVDFVQGPPCLDFRRDSAPNSRQGGLFVTIPYPPPPTVNIRDRVIPSLNWWSGLFLSLHTAWIGKCDSITVRSLDWWVLLTSNVSPVGAWSTIVSEVWSPHCPSKDPVNANESDVRLISITPARQQHWSRSQLLSTWKNPSQPMNRKVTT